MRKGAKSRTGEIDLFDQQINQNDSCLIHFPYNLFTVRLTDIFV